MKNENVSMPGTASGVSVGVKVKSVSSKSSMRSGRLKRVRLVDLIFSVTRVLNGPRFMVYDDDVSGRIHSKRCRVPVV